MNFSAGLIGQDAKQSGIAVKVTLTCAESASEFCPADITATGEITCSGLLAARAGLFVQTACPGD
jgi:hypothetical protein